MVLLCRRFLLIEKLYVKTEEYFKSKKQDITNVTEDALEEALNAVSGNILKIIPEWEYIDAK